MKLIVTGSLGNISAPLIKELVQKGHAVTVISSKRKSVALSKPWARRPPSAPSKTYGF